jgi:adenine-specific DNA-methyltransferase
VLKGGGNVARRRNTRTAALQEVQAYRHPEAESPLRPDVGTQSQFKKKKLPVTYRYDSSLSPVLSWDGQNPARELGEWLVGLIEKAAALPPPHVFDKPQEFKRGDGQIIATVRSLKDAVDQLKRLASARVTRPMLDRAEGQRVHTIETVKRRLQDVVEQVSV